MQSTGGGGIGGRVRSCTPASGQHGSSAARQRLCPLPEGDGGGGCAAAASAQRGRRCCCCLPRPAAGAATAAACRLQRRLHLFSAHSLEVAAGALLRRVDSTEHLTTRDDGSPGGLQDFLLWPRSQLGNHMTHDMFTPARSPHWACLFHHFSLVPCATTRLHPPSIHSAIHSLALCTACGSSWPPLLPCVPQQQSCETSWGPRFAGQHEQLPLPPPPVWKPKGTRLGVPAAL